MGTVKNLSDVFHVSLLRRLNINTLFLSVSLRAITVLDYKPYWTVEL